MWTHLDTFSGIGGFALAAAWTGRIRTVQLVEIDPFCRRVLAKHWPEVPQHDDIRTFTGEHLQEALMRGAKRNPEYDEAVALYESGQSIAQVAERFGVTRQSMHKILKRRGVEMRSNLRYGPEHHWHGCEGGSPPPQFGETNHFYRGGSIADDHAQNVAEVAVREGRLIPQPCEVCGADGTFKDGRREVQAHHDDYNKPLEVRWLCQKCHHAWHKTNTPIRKEVMPTEAPRRLDLLTGGFP